MIVQPAYISNQNIDIIQDVFAITLDDEKYIDILERDFGIGNARELFSYKVGFGKQQLKALLDDKYQKNNFNKIHMSGDLVKASEIRDIYNNEIFDKKDNANGWFIFIDECIVANWSHPCRYIFVLNENDITELIHKWPPKKNIEMEVMP